MTLIRATKLSLGVLVCGTLAACGGPTLSETCDEPQAYQAVVPTKRVVVPEGLDPLDESREMAAPEATTAHRPPGSKCIESPPSVLSDSE